MRLVDSHAHLDDPRFAEDLEAVMERAARQGVATVLTVGCLGEDPRVPERVGTLLERWSCLRAAFGVHPHDARFMDDRLEARLCELMADPRVLGWGEIGLDYYYDNSPRTAQREAFARQVALAKAAGKPVIIHTRDAEEDTLAILSEAYPKGSERPGVLHCFSGSARLAEACLERGFFISFGGIVTFKKADSLREIAASVPSDRLLIETDSPYLAPVPHRGRRNEPAFVECVLNVLSGLRGLEPADLGERIWRNFELLFAPAEEPQGRDRCIRE
ncbi:MAG: TatD family hydrolase [Acidobacteriota bacterium]